MKTLIGEIHDGVFEFGDLHCVAWSGSYSDRGIHVVSACTNTRQVVALILEANLTIQVQGANATFVQLESKRKLEPKWVRSQC